MFSFLVVLRYFFFFPSNREKKRIRFESRRGKEEKRLRKAFDFSCFIHFDENNNCEERGVTWAEDQN
jgi:hypothetical protein